MQAGGACQLPQFLMDYLFSIPAVVAGLGRGGRWLVLLGGLLFLSLTAAAQTGATGVLSGSVRDSATQKPIVGASVRLVGLARGAATDALGNFYLRVPAGAYSLVVSYLGFETQTRAVAVRPAETTAVGAVALPTAALNLREVTVTQNVDLNQTLSIIGRVDRQLRPTNSAQDLLRLVPGLFIAQHAGGGKAEQIFLRGFDIDHGTDFAVSIDGMPVNMVSHAHGQGYADFHFVIPEVIEAVNVYKGPYSARFGDFATAGAGEFTTKNEIKQNLARVEVGQFGTFRGLVVADVLGGRHLLSKQKESAYLAAEYLYTDAYFSAPQKLNRFNGMAKYNGLLSDRTSLTLLGSHFTSRWDASGQVPDRAVRAGLISRFGAIDATEGGTTSRTNATAKLVTVVGDHDAVLTNQVYYSKYNFDLYSNFTFLLNDPINGDQIRQRDNGRDIYGYNGTFEHTTALGARTLKTTVGGGTRLDDTEVGLFRAIKRRPTDTTSLAHVYEQNVHGYLDEVLTLTDRLTLNAAVRYDHFFFRVRNLRPETVDSLSGQQDRGIVSPKLNLYYTVNSGLQFFVRSGLGFHSNDARGVVRATTQRILPRATGGEIGATFKVGPRILLNVALWGLDMQNELVYVGDEGIVEITGRTRRVGTDFAVRAQLTDRLYFDADANFNHGRLRDAPADANRIPLAPTFTSTGGVTYRAVSGLSGALRYRALDTRPATEDNSIRARGYGIFDVVAAYTQPRYQVGFTIENLLNRRWNEAQFATQSRLPGEGPDGVEELHYTPGTPFFLKGNVSVFF